MITEDYVSFDTAKLLKAKGFDELTYACFSNDGKETYYGYRAVGNDINRPTLQMAMKWLREVKEIVIEVSINFNIDDDYKWYYEYGFCIFQLSNTFKKIAECDYDGYKTYEEACEAAIKYCLENLI